MKMNQLLNGVAIAAALAIAGPVWAQNPTGGNGMGMPGPNPGGGGGLTPYSTGASPPPAMAAPPPASTSAMPPMHRAARAHHTMHHMAAKPLPGDTANQLNQQELARLQAASAMPPPAPMGTMPPPAPMPSPSGGNSMGMPGPSMGGPGLTPYSTGTPQR